MSLKRDDWKKKNNILKSFNVWNKRYNLSKKNNNRVITQTYTKLNGDTQQFNQNI